MYVFRDNNNMKFQGTLMALAAFSQDQLLGMLKSAALLSPIAHLNQITSQPTKLAADLFIANVRYRNHTKLLVEQL